ncbi:MAG: hypothetical protein JST89_20540 [Cyanobacteria bacterium SZAS-4]|nr:hypothetical protein [Cyanobacteria bacterium SZAS-4]
MTSHDDSWDQLVKRHQESGEPVDQARQAQLERLSDENNEIKKRFPDHDGVELAKLLENGDIYVIYASSSSGHQSHGERTYSRTDKQYRHTWERHKMDQWNGSMHYIAKKWDVDANDSIDLGDGWLK